jgi:hypothetical protein
VPSIGAVQPVHVATWIEAGTRELAAPHAHSTGQSRRHCPGLRPAPSEPPSSALLPVIAT